MKAKIVKRGERKTTRRFKKNNKKKKIPGCELTSLSTPPKTHQRKPWRTDKRVELLRRGVSVRRSHSEVSGSSSLTPVPPLCFSYCEWTTTTKMKFALVVALCCLALHCGHGKFVFNGLWWFWQTFTRSGGGFWQDLLYVQAVSPLRGVTQTVVRGPSGVSLFVMTWWRLVCFPTVSARCVYRKWARLSPKLITHKKKR